MADMKKQLSYTASQIDALLGAVPDKVDKVQGKGLSTNDYTNAEKTVVAASTENIKNLAVPYQYGNNDNSGVKVIRDSDFKAIVTGTATATLRYIVTQITLKAGSYILSGCTDGSASTWRLRLGTGSGNTYVDAVTTEEKSFTLNSDTLVTIEINVFTGTTISNKVFPVMIREANISDSTYVPPVLSVPELTKKVLYTAPDAPLRILCVGDSISYGARNGFKGYVGGLGYPYQTDGETGATISTKQTQRKNIPQQLIDSTYQNPDVIIANGGVNDYLKHAPLGTIPTAPITTDAADTALDKSTICGGAQHLFYNMIKLHPDAQRFFLCTHKTTAEVETYTYGNNLASVTTQTRQTNGVDFVNNGDDTFAIFRTASTDAPAKAAFKVYEVQLSAGTYLLDALDGGKWVSGSNEVMMMRYTDKSNDSVLADVTDKPKLLTLAASKTVVCTMWVGKKYNGVYKIITPVMKACTETEVVQDWTVSQNRALLTQTNIFDAIKAVAKLYGVKVIDVFGESMMNTAFDPYVSSTSWASDKTITNTEYCDSDGIHPLDKGYNQAYLPLIRKALQIGTEK